ncbi:MAG TPA: preprotein translocase subunit SecG, partial [Burkholderiaceae bacterium]|nr:preprotein translocase subunit SecG [Burkholderiaceae bacterium]
GASGSLFGATGSANFLSRSTAVCATLFFVCTLGLAYFGSHRDAGTSQDSLLERAAPVAASAPAAAASGAAAIPDAPAAVQPAASGAGK